MPVDKNVKKRTMPLLAALREQKKMQLKGGIYHRTQIDMTYNSNHIEGSRLTKERTRYIFETVLETPENFRTFAMEGCGFSCRINLRAYSPPDIYLWQEKR